MKKKCLWCKKRSVSLFGKYDEFSNACDVCVPSGKSKNEPLTGEWSRHTKAELQSHAKDVLQPRTKNGRINPDFVSVYGTHILEKEMKMSKQEIMANTE